MSKMGKPRRNGSGGAAENIMMEFEQSFFDYDDDDQNHYQQNYDAGGGGDDNDEEYGEEGYNNDNEEMEVLIPSSRLGTEAYQSTNLNPEMLDYLHEDQQAQESDNSYQPSADEPESEDLDDDDNDDMLGYAKTLGSRKGPKAKSGQGNKGRPRNNISGTSSFKSRNENCHPSIVILHQLKFPNRVNIFKTVHLRREPFNKFILDEKTFVKKIKLSNEKNRLICKREIFKTPNQQEFGFKDPRFKDRRFICSVCNERFNSSSHLKRHWTRHHDTTRQDSVKNDKEKDNNDVALLFDPTQEKPYICTVCKKGFSSPHHLKQHLTTHGIGKDVITCKYCSYTGSKYIVEKHMKTKKSCSNKIPTALTCVFCDKTYPTKRNLRRHIQRVHRNGKMAKIVPTQSDRPKPGPASSKILIKPQPTSTSFTAKIRPGPASSKMQVVSKNPPIIKPGPSSSKSKPNQGISLLKPSLKKPGISLLKPSLSLKKPGPASSKLSISKSKPGPASFKSKSVGKNETPQDLNLNKFICNICDGSFTDKILLTRHMMKDHVTVKPTRKLSKGSYICKFCSASCFNTELELDEHCEKHTDHRNFSCTLCPSKRFGDINLLRKHVKRSHNERTLSIFCQLCNKGFVNELGLYSHLQTTHAKEKLVRIPIKSPKMKEPTYKKPEPKPYRPEPKLIKTVEGRVGVGCTDCSDIFATQTLMRRHFKRIHEERKSLTVQCPHSKCSKKFVNEHGLKCHLQSVHHITKSRLQNYILNHDIEIYNDDVDQYSQDPQDLDENEVVVNEEGVVDPHNKDLEVYNDIDQYENPEENENYEIEDQDQQGDIDEVYTCTSCGSVFYTEKLYQQHVKWICQNDSFSSTPVFSNYTDNTAAEGDIDLGDVEIEESNGIPSGIGKDLEVSVDDNLEKKSTQVGDQKNQDKIAVVDDDIEGDFRCDVCLKSFVEQEDFEQHVRESVKCQEF